MTDIIVPTEQEGTKAIVKTWLKKVGDRVSVGDPLVEQLCRLVCASIVKQVEDEVGKNRRLLNQVKSRG